MIKILMDDREKKHTWDQLFFGDRFIVTRKRLKLGDYTIYGKEKLFIVERKSSIEEFDQNFRSTDRARFIKLLRAYAEIPTVIFIIEDSINSLRRPTYSGTRPTMPRIRRIIKLLLDYKIQVLWLPRNTLSRTIITELFIHAAKPETSSVRQTIERLQ